MKLKKVRLNLAEMGGKIWFTSDTHWGHTNIIEYCDRPFKHTDEMNEVLITNWNACVPKDGVVFHLGDFAFMPTPKILNILRRLNGSIHYIDGNHDKNFNEDCLDMIEAYYGDRVELVVKDQEMDMKQVIVLDHFPIESWHHAYHGAWHLHGHCHGTVPSAKNQARLDVGVDVHNYRPISYEQVKLHMTRKVMDTKGRDGTEWGKPQRMNLPEFENEDPA